MKQWDKTRGRRENKMAPKTTIGPEREYKERSWLIIKEHVKVTALLPFREWHIYLHSFSSAGYSNFFQVLTLEHRYIFTCLNILFRFLTNLYIDKISQIFIMFAYLIKISLKYPSITEVRTERSWLLFTNPSARAGYDTRSIFKRSLTGFNSEFSFS